MRNQRNTTSLFGNIPKHDYLGLFSDHDPKKVVRYLKFTQADVASATRIAKASIRYDEKMPPELVTRLLEIATVCELVAEYFNGDLEKTALWFKLKNPLLGSISPRDMIRIGRYEKLMSFIQDALSGEAP